jgi:hypothetical protein
MSSDMIGRLVTELGIDTRALYRLPGPFDLSGLTVIADLDPPKVPLRSGEHAHARQAVRC